MALRAALPISLENSAPAVSPEARLLAQRIERLLDFQTLQARVSQL